MKEIDQDGLLLSGLQAMTFELSVEETPESSEIFVRRFMNSQISRSMDSGDILQTNMQPKDLLEQVEEQYGESKYGSVKYTKNEMYWIGYIYRYFAYTYEMSSRQVYRIIKPKEMRVLFLPYHTMDPAQAIERILEAKGPGKQPAVDIQRQYEVFRSIRRKE